MQNETLTKEEKKQLKKKIEQMKTEAAKELGLYEKVMKVGWKNLSSKESGAIGGKMSAKMRNKK